MFQDPLDDISPNTRIIQYLETFANPLKLLSPLSNLYAVFLLRIEAIPDLFFLGTAGQIRFVAG